MDIAGESFDLKYRIKYFDDMLSNKETIKLIDDLLKSNTFPKFTILTGPTGSGKTTTAFIIAKTLQCQNSRGTEICGICPSCQGIDETLYKDGKGVPSLEIYTFDMGLNSDAEYVNDIAHAISAGSMMGRKVMIIEELQRTKKDVQDTLLRTLEFIPDDVYVIVTTSELHKIASAIKSRATELRFSYPDTRALREYMGNIVKEEDIRLSTEDLNELISHHNQNPRNILKSLATIKSSGRSGVDYLISLKTQENERFIKYFQSVREGVIEVIDFIDRLESKAVFLHQLKYFIKDAIKMRYVSINVKAGYRKQVAEVLGKYTDEQLYEVLDILNNIPYISDNDAELSLMVLAYKLNRMMYHQVSQEDPIPVQKIDNKVKIDKITESMKISAGTVSLQDL